MRHQLLAQFLRGEFADVANQKLASQITRLVLAGDSMVQPSKVDDVLRGSYRTAKLNEEVYRGIDEVLGLLELWLDQVSQTMDVDIMPGEMDFSNAFMPQQPFNSCLFPLLAAQQRESINLVTNPHQFEINGINFLGTSGQNIRDMLLISEVPPGHSSSEADKCLFRMEQTLEMRHLCPTAPDTLRVYPFKDNDPFILESCKHTAQLDLGDEEPDTSSKTTEVPNVFFTGTMQSFGEKTLW